MSDRTRAIAVLKEARDVLLRRLSEGILESEIEILDDAHGLSYCGEIESMHEQLGARLANVNGLLAHLQSAEAEAQLMANPSREDDAIPMELLVSSDPLIVAGPDEHDLLVLQRDAATATHEAAPANFETFIEAIQASDLAAASRCLAELFGIDERRAWSCAVTFREQCDRSPEFLSRAKSLRSELQSSVNGSLMLLWECFGLAVPESIIVLQALKTRLGYP